MTDSKILKPIKQYNLKSTEQGKYVPILDKDAMLSARSLTLRDMKSSYKILKETFEEIKEERVFHEPLAETLLFSRENFIWFATLLKELENLLCVETPYSVPFEKCPKSVSVKPPIVYQPFYATSKKGKVLIHTYKSLSKKLHPINSYRIKYIMENYDMSDFVDKSYPSWYLLKNTVVFEQYSEKTNTRVRIDFRDGKFMYFIAGASDNWKVIEGVPDNMDHVIAALLFRNYTN